MAKGTLGTPPSRRSQPVIGPSWSQVVSALGKYPPHQEPSALFLIHKHTRQTLSRPSLSLSFHTLNTIATSCLPEHREPTSRPVPSASTASKCRPPTCTSSAPISHVWPNTVLVHHPSCARGISDRLAGLCGHPALAHSLPFLSVYFVCLEQLSVAAEVQRAS